MSDFFKRKRKLKLKFSKENIIRNSKGQINVLTFYLFLLAVLYKEYFIFTKTCHLI
jgi:hypothetical protein